MRDEAVEDQAGEEGAENAFQPAEVGKRGCHEHHGQHEGVLKHGVRHLSEKQTDELRKHHEQTHDEKGELAYEQQPEIHAAVACESA